MLCLRYDILNATQSNGSEQEGSMAFCLVVHDREKAWDEGGEPSEDCCRLKNC